MNARNDAAQSGDRAKGRTVRSFRNPTIRKRRTGRFAFDCEPLPDWMEDMTLGEFERMRSEGMTDNV